MNRHIRLSLVGLVVLACALAGAGAVFAQDPTAPPPDTGTLDLFCNISNVKEGEVVACQVTIDGGPQPDIAPGQTVSFPLPFGDHAVTVAPIGESASRWEPASLDKTVTISSATAPKKLDAKFVKKGHLLVTLKQEGVTADFFVDTQPAGTQVASVDLWLTPNKSHKIEVKNVVDPAANGIYGWNDNTQTVSVTPASDKTLVVNLVKKPIKGFLKIKCSLPSVQPTDAVVCRPTIDTVVQPDIAAGTEAIFPLDKGAHAAQVDLVGDSAHLWAPQTAAKNVTIAAGATATFAPVFTKSGHLIVTLDQPGVIADFYLDGALVAAQAAGFDAWVTPNKSHKVEVKSVVDPNAGGLYYWKDASTTATVSAGAEKSVVVKLAKVSTAGTLNVICIVNNVPPPWIPFTCGVYVDGARVGDVAPNSTGSFLVPVGDHVVTIVGAPEDQWTGNPSVHYVTVKLNQPTSVGAYFNLSW